MGDEEDSVGAAKTGVQIVGELIKAAGDDPTVKKAAHNLGETALTVTKLVNNALLPLAAINFAFEKARDYFAKYFETDLAAKTKQIPSDEVVEPKASVAGPVLQGLAFTHEELGLKEMYLSLLATAMDRRIAFEAHPAFVEVIRQLTSEEARLLREILAWSQPQPIVEIRRSTDSHVSYVILMRHVMHYTSRPQGEPLDEPRMSAMVDNWIRLGLVTVDYSSALSDPDTYTWAAQRPELRRFRAHFGSGGDVFAHNGIISVTSFGALFAKAAGLAQVPILDEKSDRDS